MEASDKFDYPISTALRCEMAAVSERFTDEYVAELEKLGNEERLARKILKIQEHTSRLSKTFVEIQFNRPTVAERTAVAEKGIILSGFDIPDDIKSSLSADEYSAWVTYVFANIMLEKLFVEKRAVQLESRDPNKKLEARVIIGTLTVILAEWRRIWNKLDIADVPEWKLEALSGAVSASESSEDCGVFPYD